MIQMIQNYIVAGLFLRLQFTRAARRWHYRAEDEPSPVAKKKQMPPGGRYVGYVS